MNLITLIMMITTVLATHTHWTPVDPFSTNPSTGFCETYFIQGAWEASEQCHDLESGVSVATISAQVETSRSLRLSSYRAGVTYTVFNAGRVITPVSGQWFKVRQGRVTIQARVEDYRVSNVIVEEKE